METLKESWQFERVRREGRTWASGFLVLNAAPNDYNSVQCAFIAGKKVGGAVERNRAKRLMREAIRARLPLVRPGWDLVWIGRSGIAEARAGSVGSDMDVILKRSRLFIVKVETEAP